MDQRQRVAVEQKLLAALQANHAGPHLATHQLVQQVAVLAAERLPGFALAAHFPLDKLHRRVGL